MILDGEVVVLHEGRPVLRELKAKGESARFQKVERGRFILAQAAR